MLSKEEKIIITIFLIINGLYLGMGLGLLIIGALELSELASVNTDQVKPLLDAIKFDSFQMGTTATSLSSLFMISGVVILVGVILMFPLFWFKKKYILLVYLVLVVVLLVMHIVLIALWFTMKAKMEGNAMKANMLANLISDFKDDTITYANSVSNAWNYMFMTLDCCAVNVVSGTANDFDTTTWCTTSGSCQATSSQIPKTCCINVDENTYSSAPSGCHASVNPGTYNSKGCHDALKDKLLSYTDSIEIVAITTIFIEIVVVIFVVYCQLCSRTPITIGPSDSMHIPSP